MACSWHHGCLFHACFASVHLSVQIGSLLLVWWQNRWYSSGIPAHITVELWDSKSCLCLEQGFPAQCECALFLYRLSAIIPVGQYMYTCICWVSLSDASLSPSICNLTLGFLEEQDTQLGCWIHPSRTAEVTFHSMLGAQADLRIVYSNNRICPIATVVRGLHSGSMLTLSTGFPCLA